MDIKEDLLKQCAGNNTGAQKELFEACFPYLMSICRLYSKDDQEAMSLLNLGFYKILNGLAKKKKSVPFRPWCRRVQINAIIDEFKKHKKKNAREVSVEEWERYETGMDSISQNLADLMFDAEDIVAMIRQLPETTATVFNLYALEECPYSEISTLLGITESTARWHVSNARKKLIKMLRVEYPEKNIKYGTV